VKETRGETNRHETLIETQVPDHAATTGPRKRGNHHSPMKHSKRRMLGPMVKAGGTPFIFSRPSSRLATSSR
jgi:hypothetical protein